MYQDTLKDSFKELFTASKQTTKLTTYNSGVEGAIYPGAALKAGDIKEDIPAIMGNINGANRITVQGMGRIPGDLADTDITDKYFDVMFYARSSGSGFVPLFEARFTLGYAVDRVEGDSKWYICNKVALLQLYCNRKIEINGCDGETVIAGATAELSSRYAGGAANLPRLQTNRWQLRGCTASHSLLVTINYYLLCFLY